MMPERIVAIQKLIDLHFPAANRIDVDIHEGGELFNTFNSPSLRDQAIHVFNELLMRFGGVAEVTQALEDVGAFGDVTQGREKICYLKEVVEKFHITFPAFGLGDRYFPLSEFDMSMQTGRYLCAKRYGEVWGVSVHFSDRALWEFDRGQAENAKRFIEAGRKERYNAFADTGISSLDARPYTPA